MSGDIRVFVNATAVDLEPGSDVRAALRDAVQEEQEL